MDTYKPQYFRTGDIVNIHADDGSVEKGIVSGRGKKMPKPFDNEDLWYHIHLPYRKHEPNEVICPERQLELVSIN